MTKASHQQAKPQILSPAGSMESLIAAVSAGADAVYFGAGTLSARRNASNFDSGALREAAVYLCARGVKAYLTLNTIVYDTESGELRAHVQAACESGFSGIIVQDLSAAAFVRRCAPDMPLLASTQMAVHNLEGIKQLEDMGFSRAVLARELSRDEIAEITANSRIETELFVHGALCVCVSGQCYLSAMLGTRSANRGLCAQPCRLPFTSRDGRENALSLKDLSLIEHISEISGLGITSLKIEGRMKRPEYVAAATAACRAALDGQAPDMDRLRAVFSRSGFTDGYFTGRRGADMFGARQREDVAAASESVLRSIRSSYDGEYPRVPLDMRLTLKAGLPAHLTVSDADSNTVSVSGAVPEAALSKPTTPEMAQKSLLRLGGTFYLPGSVDVRVDENIAVPVSQINLLRREALERLTKLREAPHAVKYEYIPGTTGRPPPSPPAPALRAALHSASQLTPDMLESCDMISLLPKELLSLDGETLRRYADKLAVEAPRIVFGEYPAGELRAVRELGITRALAGNLGALRAAREAGFELHGDFPLNVSNSAAIDEYAKLGLSDITLSPELTLTRIKALGGSLPRGIAAYGHMPLMALRNCPGAGGCARCGKGSPSLTDRKGISFRTYCSYGCSYLLNPNPIYLADKLPELCGLHFISLRFTFETPRECDELLGQYKNGGKAKSGHTRGLYYRAVR